MNLTPKEILTALKYCNGQLGGAGCDGCPNHKSGGEDCECRFNLNDEIMSFLEECCRKEDIHDGTRIAVPQENPA